MTLTQTPTNSRSGSERPTTRRGCTKTNLTWVARRSKARWPRMEEVVLLKTWVCGIRTPRARSMTCLRASGSTGEQELSSWTSPYTTATSTFSASSGPQNLPSSSYFILFSFISFFIFFFVYSFFFLDSLTFTLFVFSLSHLFCLFILVFFIFQPRLFFVNITQCIP